MSLLLLKKKIQERMQENARLHATFPTATKWLPAFQECKDILEMIDELEKEEVSAIDQLDKILKKEIYHILREPMWSGRSEKEIRERIKMWQDKIGIGNENDWALHLFIRELEWVLSKEKKECDYRLSRILNDNLK